MGEVDDRVAAITPQYIDVEPGVFSTLSESVGCVWSGWVVCWVCLGLGIHIHGSHEGLIYLLILPVVLVGLWLVNHRMNS